MTKAVNPMPPNYPGVIPYLIVQDAAAALEFYKTAFEAEETMRLVGKNGAIMHAEFRIGSAAIMLSGEWPDMGHRSPEHYGGVSSSLCVYVPNVDAFAARATAAGAEIIQPLETKLFGDRTVTLRDPSGYIWAFMTHVEDVSNEEMQRRMNEMLA